MKLRSLILSVAPVVGLALAVQFPMSFASDAAPVDQSIQTATPHRMIVLSDIENEPDDTESFVRLMLYSNEIDLKGLVATTSTWKRTSVAPESIRAVIDAYAKVHANLLKHDPRYPAPESLQALVKGGQPAYGMSAVGDGRDSEGSDWIIHVLDEDDDRPLWISVWGGSNTLAQALFRLRATRDAADVNRLVGKLRVHAISDQDDSGVWIRKNFPTLFYVVSPGGNYGSATWGAINSPVDGIDNTTISNRWLAENIQQGHGPLGAMYPDVSWGMEGDTPSWLGLIPNGLNEPEHPDWGGWGGRYELYVPEFKEADPKTFFGGVPNEPETRPIWTSASDDFAPPVRGEFNRATRPGPKWFKGPRVTLWRWRDDFQNDFAARMEWTTESYAGANHPPVPVLDRPETLTVSTGATFELSARGSYDPDGDSLSYFWFVYHEAGTLKERVAVNEPENSVRASVTAPKVDKPGTMHVILRVSDKGSPPLSRYKRIIVTVTP